MNKLQHIEGRWWLYGDDTPPQFGILSFDPEKELNLNVKILQSRTTTEHFRAMLAANRQDDVPGIIHGTDGNNQPVTLLGCSLRQWSKSKGLDTFQIHCQAAILNCRGSSWDSPQFPAVGIKFTLLTRWLNRDFFKKNLARQKRQIKRRAESFEFNLPDNLEFQLSANVKMKIEGYPHPNSSSYEFSLRQEHTLYFLFAKPASAQSIYNDYVLVFQRLLSLLTGERIFIQSVTFFNRDPFAAGRGKRLESHELLLENHGIGSAKYDVHGAHMIANYQEIAGQFGSILKQWFERYERLGPVLDLYFAILSNWVLTDTSRFLYLAQAIEVYHSRSNYSGGVQTTAAFRKRRDALLKKVSVRERAWLKEKLHHANQKTLAERLQEILDSHPAEARQLTAKIIDFPGKVRHARNYYTHYDHELWQSGKVPKDLELRRIMYALLDLFQICLLKDLGIRGKPIERILERNSSMRWADLE